MNGRFQVDYTHENHSSVVEANERDQVRVCVKVFLTRFEENALHEAVHKGECVCKTG